jgi:thioesterase domain-containing protein
VLAGLYAVAAGAGLSIKEDEIAELGEFGAFDRIVDLLIETRLTSKTMARQLLQRLVRAMVDHAGAWSRYEAAPYDGDITLFRAAHNEPKMIRMLTRACAEGAPDYGWSRVVGGRVDVVTVAGDHYSLLRHPHVDLAREFIALRLNHPVHHNGAAPDADGSTHRHPPAAPSSPERSPNDTRQDAIS